MRVRLLLQLLEFLDAPSAASRTAGDSDSLASFSNSGMAALASGMLRLPSAIAASSLADRSARP